MKNGSKALIGVIVVIVLVVGGYLIYHKSPGSTSGGLYGSSGNTPAASTAASTGAVVQTLSASNVGSYLADSNGDALYTYGGDSAGTSTVSGGLLSSWPAYAASGTATLPANVTIITRSDGTKQYAYKGLPLYTFVADSSGQVTGDGVSNFHVAKP